jgi:hypothetical protein
MRSHLAATNIKTHERYALKKMVAMELRQYEVCRLAHVGAKPRRAVVRYRWLLCRWDSGKSKVAATT